MPKKLKYFACGIAPETSKIFVFLSPQLNGNPSGKWIIKNLSCKILTFDSLSTSCANPAAQSLLFEGLKEKS